jgi:hypothetical protein
MFYQENFLGKERERQCLKGDNIYGMCMRIPNAHLPRGKVELLDVGYESMEIGSSTRERRRMCHIHSIRGI